jgi:dihydrofolate synthase/folylpolyglutamate synthase
MDVAHNPDAVHTLVCGLRERELIRLVVVFGVMRDKDYISMIRELAPVTVCLIPVVPKSERALRLRQLTGAATRAGLKVRGGGSVASGIRIAAKLASKRASILITGSHYVVGEAIAVLARGRL